MKRIELLAVALVALTALPAHADLLQAASVPARLQANAAQDVTLAITWRVTTTPGHAFGATSIAGTLVDALTGAPLGTVGTPVGTITGGGTLSYPESLTVTAAQVAQWRAQGIRSVGYRRTFTSQTPGTPQAQLLITLQPGALASAREITSGELVVRRMELSFADGKRIAIVARGEKLTATLHVAYTGSGTLHGRWEVADPASSALPFFRLLATVREPLAGTQSASLTSLALPTLASGRYVLRFCLDSADARGECVDSSAAVQTLYEVSTAESLPSLTGLTPHSGPVSDTTVFRWPAAAGATTYQLQIFRARPGEPEFVTGMLLAASTREALLSELVRAKLDAGAHYRWRITAHDADGRLIARSDELSFEYRP